MSYRVGSAPLPSLYAVEEGLVNLFCAFGGGEEGRGARWAVKITEMK